MDFFRGHRLEQNNDGYTLILYINPEMTEFAQEFINADDGQHSNLTEKIKKYIDSNFKDIKINTVKLATGAMIIATIVLGATPVVTTNTAQAAAAAQAAPSVYSVQPGDSLWKISQKFGISIAKIKQYNKLTGDTIYTGQQLKLSESDSPGQSGNQGMEYTYHRVAAGDSLWTISRRYGVSVDSIIRLNGLASTVIYPGQNLKVKENQTEGITYTVKAGDTLWKIARDNNSTVDAIKFANTLKSDVIMVGQKLFIPKNTGGDSGPKEVYTWPDATYIVQPGDTATSIAKKFNVSAQSILKFNYMTPDEWFDAGDKIAISGYAPRKYTVKPWESSAPSRVGKQVDWVLEGQYVIKRNDVFTIVDVDTGRQFRVKMLGGYNHSDVEPITRTDTEVMSSLFGNWQWSPRAVVIYKDGMNIAASLSGMPHSAQTITDNGVTGHFDLYLQNSSPHSGTASPDYLNQHRSMVAKAAGQYK